MHAQTSANAFGGGAGSGPATLADSSRISKELLQEIRRGDASMAQDLVALAPRSGRAYRVGAAAASTHEARSATANAAGATATSAAAGSGYSVNVNDTLTASDFVKQKREVGLVRMSLATKRAEIRKLDEKVDRAEKRLRQQQEQLTNTQERFNNFLKFSNLEQDAAVRKADDETRAKHAKTIEIKKLSALINHAELETRKTRLQIENCVAYKDFLEGLAKSQWFYDVLMNVRMEDKREEILLTAETRFQKRCGELRKAFEERAAARQAVRELEERDQRRRSSAKKKSVVSGIATSASALARGGQREDRASNAQEEAGEEEEEEASLDQQMDDLHDSMEAEARAAIAAAEAAIRTEVAAMTLPSVKAALHHDYDESRLPMCFAGVDELLEVFINVEEGNLFLIQNCQELEEELEGISIGFMEEKAEMSTMVSQRTAQLGVLEASIVDAREKLKALEDRLASLEPRGGAGRGLGSAASTANDASGRASSSAAGGTGAAALSPQADLSPEELKVRIEGSIGHMFQLLTAGDQVIKANATRKESTGTEVLHSSSGGASPSHGGNGGGGSSSGNHQGAPSKAAHRLGDSAANTSFKGASRPSKTLSGGVGAPLASSKKGAAAASSKKVKSSPVAQQHQQQQQQQGDASMGPVEMLTIVENKLEEYHRYLTDPSNHIDVTLIQAVMKLSDKQRRRQARLVHLASQEQEQEERIKRALERSQAPIAHRTGKPVRPRSHLATAVDKKTQRKADRASGAMESSGTSIDSDEDGAEFFR